MSESAKNDITGDSIRSKSASQKYLDNWDRIFGNNKDEDKVDENCEEYKEEEEEKE